jgi:hypothetical protein
MVNIGTRNDQGHYRIDAQALTYYLLHARAGKHYRDSATDYKALSVQRNAPRWIKALIRFGFITKPACSNYFYFMALSVARFPLADNGVSFTLKTSVEWDLECVDFYFWQGTMRRNNALLQRIATQQNLTSGVL